VRDRNELAGAAGPVARAGAGSPSPRPRPAADAERGPAVYALEEMLSEFLETRVRIELGAKKSRLSVEFADLDDLERIYRRMLSS
jgi:ParB family transcriptional regulator, chromosome partitioning protein